MLGHQKHLMLCLVEAKGTGSTHRHRRWNASQQPEAGACQVLFLRVPVIVNYVVKALRCNKEAKCDKAVRLQRAGLVYAVLDTP